ncbi:hypothetical protein U1Q18_033358 [Sarracenia purpurea var. burkii]
MEGFSSLNKDLEFNRKFEGPKDTTPWDHDEFRRPFSVNVSGHGIGSTSDFTNLNNYDDAVLKYIDQVLMQDDFEEKAGLIQDSTLHVAEKSFYDILNNKPPPSLYQPLFHQGPSSSDASVSHCCGSSSNSFVSGNNLAEPGIISDACESYHCSNGTVDGLVEAPVNANLENQSSLQYEGGMEEIKKVLLGCDRGIYDFEKNRLDPEPKKEVKDEGDFPNILLRGRRILHQEESDLEEGRSNKLLAVYSEDSVIREMFDKVLLFNNEKDEESESNSLGEESWELRQNGQAKGPGGRRSCAKKRISKREGIDMRSLLIRCVQSVASNDHKVADQLLRQIRHCAAPSGDASQRLAHCFVNALEARLVGTGSQKYKELVANNMSTSDAFRAYKMHMSALPFLKTSNYFATQTISLLAEKETSIHVIKFGIAHGTQMPPLIQRLSTRPGGPPLLRVTGIDFPRPGFRPTEVVEETGCRLASYCKRFNVPFEYNGIVQKWETIRLEDLRIKKGELLVVICLFQLHYLLDDTLLDNSPRDAVLNLIKRIRPDVFIHGVANKAYNSPFFVSRFKEALFQFSPLFDMFEACVPRENQERMKYETEIHGMEVMNIIACEGLDRVERPETYKQWQVRTLRAGLRELPLNQEIVETLKAKVKSSYHNNFFVEEAGQWMLQGWKGRVMFAISCWKST